jgi:hypothetical protein
MPVEFGRMLCVFPRCVLFILHDESNQCFGFEDLCFWERVAHENVDALGGGVVARQEKWNALLARYEVSKVLLIVILLA